MQGSSSNRVVATLAVIVIATLAASDAGARLSVIPGDPGGPRPTASPRRTPVPTATVPGQSSVAACQASIAAESGPLLDGVRRSLSQCLARGVDCLVDEAGSSACCSEAALLCQADLFAIASATRHFREAVRDGSCAPLELEKLVGNAGLGFDVAACARLVPAVTVTDHASFADCLQLLLTKAVLHQVGLTDLPRAPEALVCMGLDDALADALGADPPSCEPSPTPVPTPTPVVPTPAPTSSSPDTGPTPLPTPSPGAGGCQPALFGPCNERGFTGCCAASLGCLAVVSPSDGSGICVEATPVPSPSPTPTADVATPTPVLTPTPVGGTATPAPTATPVPTATPGATSTSGPTPSPGTGCTTLSATIHVNYDQNQFSDVAGVTVNVGYPASVAIPGFGSDASVVQRVTNLTAVSGIFSMSDQDTAINVGLVSLASVIPPGSFVRIVFDCTSGAGTPDASAFSCVPDVTTLLGSPVTAGCTIAVATP